MEYKHTPVENKVVQASVMIEKNFEKKVEFEISSTN